MILSLTLYSIFQDNTTADPEDRLAKLRPFVTLLNTRCKEVYIPTQNVSVDETLWAYQGRHHARIYNPSKRARFGLKAYKLCASDGPAAGYTSSFSVYMGRDRSAIPASTKAVLDLMGKANLLDKGYVVYTDNWYSSPTLFHLLQARKTMACGTVRRNRKYMPKDLKVERPGDVCSRSTRTGMMALSFWDNKHVSVLCCVLCCVLCFADLCTLFITCYLL